MSFLTFLGIYLTKSLFEKLFVLSRKMTWNDLNKNWGSMKRDLNPSHKKVNDQVLLSVSNQIWEWILFRNFKNSWCENDEIYKRIYKQKAWAVQKPTWMEKSSISRGSHCISDLISEVYFSLKISNSKKFVFLKFSVCRLYFDWPFRRFGTLFKMSKMNNFSNFCYFKKWKKRGHGWPWSWVFFQ